MRNIKKNDHKKRGMRVSYEEIKLVTPTKVLALLATIIQIVAHKNFSVQKMVEMDFVENHSETSITCM